MSCLALQVRTGVAKTGVIGVLRGARAGVIALRADMDAAPVKGMIDGCAVALILMT